MSCTCNTVMYNLVIFFHFLTNSQELFGGRAISMAKYASSSSESKKSYGWGGSMWVRLFLFHAWHKPCETSPSAMGTTVGRPCAH